MPGIDEEMGKMERYQTSNYMSRKKIISVIFLEKVRGDWGHILIIVFNWG